MEELEKEIEQENPAETGDRLSSPVESAEPPQAAAEESLPETAEPAVLEGAPAISGEPAEPPQVAVEESLPEGAEPAVLEDAPAISGEPAEPPQAAVEESLPEGVEPAVLEGAPATSGEPAEPPQVAVEELLSAAAEPAVLEDAPLKAVLEAIVYVADEPLTLAQLAAALEQPAARISALLAELIAEFDKPGHGVTIREVAGGYKMATKAEHHEAVRNFVKSLKPPLKLSLPALETLAVIAYKQPVTGPEIMEIRGVQGAGVLKTLLDRKLIAVAGRKNVIGKPMLYKTTREFLIQFGLKDMTELPSLKEFEEIRRMAFADSEPAESTVAAPEAAADTQPAQAPETVAEAGPETAPEDVAPPQEE
jgi:segregation and condensation protein B